MSGISTGIGLVSGINSSALIEQLLALESRGKLPIQRRMSSIQGSKTALMDINARLLNLKNAAAGIRSGKIFDAMNAVSSDDTILTAKANTTTPPGSYQFTIGRLASASQMLTRGFATRDLTPLGLDQLSFEWGDAGVVRDKPLSELNGGQGIGRGSIRIQDRLLRTATIDLSTAVTLQDVVEKINTEDGVTIEASIENERLVLRDKTGGPYGLIVADVGGGTTAQDLGIRFNGFSSTVTGAAVNSLGSASGLAGRNDGAGVLVRDGVIDFRITVDATTYDISLGREDQPIVAATKLSDLNNGAGVKLNTTDADDFTIVTTTGTSVGINLGAVVVDGEVQDEAVETVGEMLTRINAELEASLGAGKVTVSIRADGKGFQITDTMGGAGPVKVLGTGPNADRTAKDLGLFTGAIDSGPATLVGSVVRNKVATPRAATLQDVIDRIADQTNGAVTASISPDGLGLRLSSTNAAATISVGAGTVDGSSVGASIGERTARDLGIFGLSGTGTVTGTRVASVVGSVRTSNLRGGAGLGAPASITVTDRAGASYTFSSFGSSDTLDALIGNLNREVKDAGVGVQFEISDNGHSLVARDASVGSGSISITGDGATALGFSGTTTGSTLRGADLDRRYISEGTLLSSLNFGKGIGTGVFKITDSSGETASIDIGTDSITIYDVMNEINSRGLLVEAKINDTGDGIVLVDTNTGTSPGKMKVVDTTGAVARSLGIVGEAKTAGADIDGSFERTVDLDATDTLNDVMRKVNDAGLAVTASIVNAGTGAAPFRLNFVSKTTGVAGQVFVDSGAVDLGMVRSSEGRDATLFLGTGDVSTSFLFTSSSNSFKDVVSGLEIEAKKAGSTATVEVSRNRQGIIDGVKGLVTAVNDALGRIGDYDSYEQDSQKKGPLLGNPTVARVRQQILSTVQGPAKGVEGRFRYLSQVGIRFGKEGQLQFDEAKFNAAYDLDPEAVEELFAAYEVQSSAGSTAPAEGVTVESNAITYAKLGFGDMLDQLLKKLTNSVDGVVTIADRSFQTQLDGLKQRLERFDERLEAKRTRYEAQFAAMEDALAKLQSQQSSLGSLVSLMGAR
ncbi:MAG: flagellar filament capping protein FliD [Planctomycetota bacterium]